MKKALYLAQYWLPPALWITFIFLLSSQQNVSVSSVLTINFIIFKSGHVFLYAFLFILFFRAMYSVKNKSLSLHDRYAYAIIMTLIYAVIDEIHQQFVPTRQGSLRDVAIDAVGVFIAYYYVQKYFNKIKKIFT